MTTPALTRTQTNATSATTKSVLTTRSSPNEIRRSPKIPVAIMTTVANPAIAGAFAFSASDLTTLFKEPLARLFVEVVDCVYVEPVSPAGGQIRVDRERNLVLNRLRAG